MSIRTLTNEQIKKLSKNKNVSRCSTKSVRYTKSFRASALKQYNEEGVSAVEIFQEAGFHLSVIGKRVPNRLMNQWNTASKPHALSRQPEKKTEIIVKRIENRRDTNTLKAKVAYLEAENDFLVKLRARKRV